MIVTALVICSGLTSWLLEVVHTEWYVITHKCTWTVVVEQSVDNAVKYPKEATLLTIGF